MPSTEERLESLLEVASLLSGQLERGRLLTIIMELAAKVAEAETASLLLVDDTSGELYFDVALGLAPEVQKIRLKPGQGIAGWVAKSGKTTLVPDVAADPRWDSGMDKRTGFVTRSILAVPMKHKSRVLGVIEVVNKKRGRFSTDDQRVLEAFAAQSAVALENTRLFADLRDEKRRFEAVLAEMSEGAVVTDAIGEVILANTSARNLLNEPERGGPLLEAFDGFRIEPGLERLMLTTGEERFDAKREKPKLLNLTGTVRPFTGEGGSPRRLWVFRDVTEERKEEALKQEFFSLISHKLKTPLVSILGFCDILKADTGLDDGQRRSISIISEKGRSLSALVDKLLKFTWLHGMRAAGLRKEPMSVDRLLRFASRPFEMEIEDGILNLEKGEGLDTSVMVDGKLMADALGYLIENALRFNTKKVKRVKVSAVLVNGAVEIRVEDDGPGIPPEDRRRLFKKFYQVEEKFTGQVEGWGLGLPFVDQAMRAHGGSVRLDSKLGKGTTVSLVFPGDRA